MSLSKRTSALAAIAVCSLAMLSGCGQVTVEGETEEETVTVTDDQEREVTIAGPVERAVVLNSYTNEFVRAIGSGDTVVGVDRPSYDRLDYLPVDENEIIAEGLDQLNYEAIAELDPDVVILPRNAVWQEAIEQLEGFDIPVVVATAWDYEVFDETVELLGQVFGTDDGASQLQAFYDEIFGLLDERTAGLDPVPVYLETVEPYLSVLPGSGFHAMIEAAGGENIFSDASGGDAQEELTIDPAEVVTRDPALILHEFEPSSAPADRFDEIAAELSQRPGWSGISAIEDGEIYVTNGWATSALSKAIGALYLAKWLHPDAFSDINPDDYLERWITEFQDTEFSAVDDYIRGPLG